MATFPGTSATQAVAAEDSITRQSPVILQGTCQPDQTVQHQFKEGVTTLGNKDPKKLGKRRILESSAEHGTLYCIFSGTILCMECMDQKMIPFLFHYITVLVVVHNLIYAR